LSNTPFKSKYPLPKTWQIKQGIKTLWHRFVLSASTWSSQLRPSWSDRVDLKIFYSTINQPKNLG
jgi:hypothetical protein